MSDGARHSMVIASDYRVPDPDRVWPLLERNKPALASIGAHHVLVYKSMVDPGRVLVTIGVRSREPIVELLRSQVFFDWFDAAGVEDIPAVFAGEIIGRFVAESVGAPEVPEAPGVMVAVMASIHDAPSLVDRIRSAMPGFTAASVRKTWVFRAFDDEAEVLILQEFADEDSARSWIERPDATAEWVTGAGVGAYPPVFLGRLVAIMGIEAD